MNYLRNLFLIIIGILSCSTYAFSENPFIYPDTIDNMSKNVVYLRKQSPTIVARDGKQVEIWTKDPHSSEFKQLFNSNSGTGFIVLHNNRGYVVTAKHVARELTSEPFSVNSEIISNLTTGKTFSVKFSDLRSLKVTSGARWFYHKSADIAIHPAVQIKDLSDSKAIPSRRCFKNDSDVELTLLSKCFIIGFPLGFGLSEMVSPLAKEANISSGITSIDNTTIDPNLKYILLDDAIAQGYSGSPVFLTKEVVPESLVHMWEGAKPVTIDEVQLIGLVSGTISDDTGGKITLIVPICYIWDIFNSPEFIEYEKKLE